jgi:hypothetical protein
MMTSVAHKLGLNPEMGGMDHFSAARLPEVVGVIA